MALPNILVRDNRAFTLVEILIVMAIVGILFSLGLFLGLDSYKRYIFHGEQSKIVDVLEKTRSRAMNNFYQIPHGVCLDNSLKSYVIFRGSFYTSGSPTNEAISANTSLTINGMNCGSDEIVFSQLSGDTSLASISLSDGVSTANININEEGAIHW